MLNVLGNEKKEVKSSNLIGSLFIGSAIGLFSGMIGIGGGIILSPIIILLGWGNMKQAAAVSALIYIGKFAIRHYWFYRKRGSYSYRVLVFNSCCYYRRKFWCFIR